MVAACPQSSLWVWSTGFPEVQEALVVAHALVVGVAHVQLVVPQAAVAAEAYQRSSTEVCLARCQVVWGAEACPRSWNAALPTYFLEVQEAAAAHALVVGVAHVQQVAP